MGSAFTKLRGTRHERKKGLFIQFSEGSTHPVYFKIVDGTSVETLRKRLAQMMNLPPDMLSFRDSKGGLFVFSKKHLHNTYDTAYICGPLVRDVHDNDGATLRNNLSYILATEGNIDSTASNSGKIRSMSGHLSVKMIYEKQVSDSPSNSLKPPMAKVSNVCSPTHNQSLQSL